MKSTVLGTAAIWQHNTKPNLHYSKAMISPLNGGYVNFWFGVLNFMLQSTVALDYGFQLDLYGLNHGWLSLCLTWYRDKVEAALSVQSNHK